ncbi:MAG: transglycosylase SLT domain-containing protein, partial [Hyphomicrobiales bacterium]
ADYLAGGSEGICHHASGLYASLRQRRLGFSRGHGRHRSVIVMANNLGFTPALHEGLAKKAAGDDWAWAAAVVEHESGWNPLAVGDDGLAVGLFQMHPSFIAWIWPEYSTDGAMLRLAHTDPFFQADTFERFWARKFATLQPADKLMIYHYGETKAASLAKAENPDPDGYVAAIRALVAEINPAAVAPAAKPAAKGAVKS